MSNVIFKRLLTPPATLPKGEVALTRNADNTATMYVGNNYNEPTRLTGNGEIGKGAVCAWKTGAAVGTTGALTNYTDYSVNDGAFNPTTGIYTAQTAGLYAVSFSGIKDSGSAVCGAKLMKNGSYTGIRAYSSVPSEYACLAFSALFPLSALDTLSITIVDGNIHANESCYLTIYKIR